MNWNKFIFAGYATVCMEFDGNKYYFRIIKEDNDYKLYEIITSDISDYFSCKSNFEGSFARSGVVKNCSRKLWTRHCKMFHIAMKCLLKNRSGLLDKLNVKIYHAGYCGKCNRILKTPESIQHGIGNECFKDMNINPIEREIYVGFRNHENNKSSGIEVGKKRKKTKRCVENNDGKDKAKGKGTNSKID